MQCDAMCNETVKYYTAMIDIECCIILEIVMYNAYQWPFVINCMCCHQCTLLINTIL